MADEIGESLQKVASAAENSNVSLEKSASWVATISSITREGASVIGRSLASAIARYEQIREKGFNEEDATQINDVVKALTAVGIQGVTASGQLRPFADVIDELGAKFNSLNKNEQAYIATQLFGTFQRNRGITLLRNYEQSLKSYEDAMNSAGMADRKFSVYQESVQASLDRTRASWEGFYQASYNSDITKGMLDFTAGLLDAMTKLGGAIPIVAGLFSTLLVANIVPIINGLKSMVQIIRGLPAMLSGLAMPLNASLGGIGLIVGSIVAALVSLGMWLHSTSQEVETLSSSVKELKKQNDDLVKSFESAEKASEKRYNASLGEVEVAQQLVGVLAELSSSTNRTTNENAKMAMVVERLNELMPNLNLSIDTATGNLSKNTSEIYKNIEALKEQYKQELLAATSREAGIALVEAQMLEPQLRAAVYDAEEAVKVATEALNSAQDSMAVALNPEAIMGYIHAIADAEKTLNNAKVALDANLMSQEEYNQKIQDYIDYIGEISEKLKESPKDPMGTYAKSAQSNIAKVISGYRDINDTMKSLAKLNDIITDKNYKQSDAVKFLMDNYDSLSDSGVDVSKMLSDIGNLGEHVKQSFKDQAVASGLAYAAMTGFTKDYMGVTAAEWKSLYTSLSSMYGGDLTNFKSIAVEKAKVEGELIKILGQNWSAYYKTTSQGLAAAIQSLDRGMSSAAKRGETEAVGRLREQYNTLVAMSKLYENSALDKIESKIKTPSFSDYSGSSKSKSGEKSIHDATEEIIRQHMAQATLLELERKRLEGRLDLLGVYEDETTQLELQKEIIDKQTKQANALKKANDGIFSEYEKIAKANKGYDISSWFDKNFESTVAYKNLLNSVGEKEQKKIETLFSQAQMFQKAILENEETIKELLISNSKARIEWYEKEMSVAYRHITQRRELLSAERALLDETLTLLSSHKDSSAYTDALDMALKNSTKQMSETLKAADALQNKFSNLQKQNKAYDLSSWYDANLEKSYSFTQMLGKASEQEQIKLLETWEKGKIVLSQLRDLNSDMSKLRTDIIRYNADIIENAKNREIKAINDALEIDKKAINTRIELLKEQQKTLEENTKKEKEALEQKKKSYKDAVDNLKKLIDLEESRRKYEDDVADREKEISKVQNRISELSMDNSREAMAERAKLEEQLAKLQGDLGTTQRDRYVELQKEKYDEQYDEYAKTIDKEIKLLEDKLEREAKETERRTKELTKSIETISDKAKTEIDLISANAASLYVNLVSSTSTLDSSVLSIADSWDTVLTKLRVYQAELDKTVATQHDNMDAIGSGTAWVASSYLKDGVVTSNSLTIRKSPSSDSDKLGMLMKGDKVDVLETKGLWSKIKVRHDGIDSGFVFDKAMNPQSEEYNKLLKGELVTNPKQMRDFMNERFPNLLKNALAVGGGRGVNVTFGTLLNVEGSVDKSFAPQLGDMVRDAANMAVTEISKTFKIRGYSF